MSAPALSERDRCSALFLVLTLIWAWTLAWLLLSEPGELSLLRSPDFVLNFGHAVIFSILGALIYLGLPKSHAFLLLGFVLSGIYGILLEVLQIWAPGRICDPVDAMTNLTGVGLGMSCVAAVAVWRQDRLLQTHVWRFPLLWLLASLSSALLATLL